MKVSYSKTSPPEAKVLGSSLRCQVVALGEVAHLPLIFPNSVLTRDFAEISCNPVHVYDMTLPSVNGASGSSTLKFILLWYPYYFYSNIVLLLLTLFCTNIAIS
jgi:hypothetical protein